MKKTQQNMLFFALLTLTTLTFFSCESTKQENIATKDNAQNKIDTKQIELKIVQIPKETTKNKDFILPYKVFASDKDGKPCSNCEITTSYPSARSSQAITFGQTKIVTDELGNAEFMPPKPTFAVNSQITFFVSPTSSNPLQVQESFNKGVNAPYKVRTDLSAKTGILVAIVDYNTNDKMVLGSALSSSSNLVGELWRAGYTRSQNADFHNSVDKENPELIKRDVRNLLGNSTMFKYVVYGKVKYDSKIKKEEDGTFSLSMKGTLSCMDISTGDVILETSDNISVNDKNQWNILKKAQEALAKKFCNELLYAM